MKKLLEGEPVCHSFHPDHATYLRHNIWIAAIAMAAGMAILWVMGNAHIWTGAIGGLAAIGLCAWYLASEELAVRWDLTDTRLNGPAGRSIALRDTSALNVRASTVQVVTSSGDMHLNKYQSDRANPLDRLRVVCKEAMV